SGYVACSPGESGTPCSFPSDQRLSPDPPCGRPFPEAAPSLPNDGKGVQLIVPLRLFSVLKKAPLAAPSTGTVLPLPDVGGGTLGPPGAEGVEQPLELGLAQPPDVGRQAGVGLANDFGEDHAEDAGRVVMQPEAGAPPGDAVEGRVAQPVGGRHGASPV